MVELSNFASKRISFSQTEVNIKESRSEWINTLLDEKEEIQRESIIGTNKIEKSILKTLDVNLIKVGCAFENHDSDISSPLDTYLLSKKKRSYKAGVSIEDMQILKKIAPESDTENDFP
ncbi:hypothetical protein SteCoe_4752 [Stentor coeruleus]|uniref:Uncharacterized protein n=1 Tax=Stentor coeruleus TaxID=5963 RepID=A0A1R2CU53_9CILI|nr:hypothetical protein SteCoe_4752 [Stentor coeruleus]